MEFKFIKDDKKLVEVHSPTQDKLVNDIEELVKNHNLSIDAVNINGYLEEDIVPIKICEIDRIYVEKERTCVSYNNKTYQVKYRLYQIEEKLGNDFIRINKSCIINIKKIKRFNTSFVGTLLVELKNGDKDYVSRRMLKGLKERMGI